MLQVVVHTDIIMYVVKVRLGKQNLFLSHFNIWKLLLGFVTHWALVYQIADNVYTVVDKLMMCVFK